MPLQQAQDSYLLWTNRLLSTMRAKCVVQGGHWAYVQVTERQKRGHPHSHLLMAWIPKDSQHRKDSKGKDYIYSQWFYAAHQKAGLGTQSKITPVGSVEGTAKYIAKYLFKDAQFTSMPKHWKRVRYSQSFPSVPLDETKLPVNAFPIVTRFDWKRVEETGLTFQCEDDVIFTIASKRIHRVTRNV